MTGTIVTSHYANPEVLIRAARLGAKILPKLMVAVVPIQLAVKPPLEFEGVDIVIVDDKPQFMELLISHYLKDKKVKLYASPFQFLEEYSHYDKATPICLDYDFGVDGLNGRILSEKLHQEGYKRLYLISGYRFTDLPDYITAIERCKLNRIL